MADGRGYRVIELDARLTANFTLREFSVGGKNYYVSSQPVPSSAQLFKMNVVMFLPEEDVFGDIVAGRNIAIGIAVGVFVLGVALAIVIVVLILKPLANVASKMADAARLDMDEDAAAEELSGISEIAVLQATSTVPVVMATSRDPVGSGFVASLAHPGGNVTR